MNMKNKALSPSIVQMKEEHIEGIVAIENEVFPTPWSKNDFLRELHENKFAYYFVALHGEEVVGYAGLWHVVTEGHITNVAVKRGFQGNKIGQLLLDKMIEFGKENYMMGLTLEVGISNTNAQKLYLRNGFLVEGRRKNYYSDTREDALIMWLYFDEEEGKRA